jgi:hypothetical protein
MDEGELTRARILIVDAEESNIRVLGGSCRLPRSALNGSRTCPGAPRNSYEADAPAGAARVDQPADVNPILRRIGFVGWGTRLGPEPSDSEDPGTGRRELRATDCTS